MKRFYKFLMPLVAIVAMALPSGARAQATLTVADGTVTNGYVPIYGYYCDALLRADFVYPSTMLTSMSSGLISQMTFYSENSSIGWGSASFNVYLTEVSSATLSDFYSGSNMTLVYSGSLSVGADGTMTIPFTTPYLYGGGNLLVRVDNVVVGTYVSVSWLGISSSESSYQGYDYSDIDDIYGSSYSFLPKATFTYIAGNCPPPTGLAAAVNGSDVGFSWSSDATSFEVAWGPAGFNPDTVTVNVASTTSTSYSLTGLADAHYDFCVRAFCSDGDTSMWIRSTFFIGAVDYNMSSSGNATLSTCAANIYDNGGADGSYGNNCNSTLVVTPATPGSYLMVTGTSYTESTYDYLNLYEGNGTSGELLFDDYGVTAPQTFGPFYVDTLTVTFQSDISVTYDGYAINVVCVSAPSCPRPDSLTLVSTASDEVTLSWLDDENSSWTIAYGPQGFSIGDTNTQYADFSTTTGTITGLTPNTIYDFFLMAVCPTDSSWARSITVRTTCVPIDSLPYVQDFEECLTGSSNMFDPCWRIYCTYNTGYYYPYVTTGNENKYLYFYIYTNTNWGYALMPNLGEELDNVDMELSFDTWRNSSATYSARLIVGLFNGDSYDGTSAFDTLAVIDPTATTYDTRTTHYVTISGRTVAGKRIGFLNRFENSGSYYYCYVDNVNLHEAPTCIVPANLTASHITSDSIILSWGDDINSGASYEVKYRQRGVADSVEWESTEVSDTYAELFDLQPNTTYDVVVRTICGSGDTSMSVTGVYRTECGAISALPFVMDFENATTGSSNLFDPCWNIGNTYSPNNNYPYAYSGNGTKYLYMYMSGSNGANAYYGYAIMPELSADLAQTDMELSFDIWTTSANYGAGVIVALFDSTAYSDSSSFDTLAVVVPTANSFADRETVYINLSGVDFTGKHLGLYYHNQRPNITNSNYYTHIDNFNLHVAPDCPMPAGLTVDSLKATAAYVHWDAEGNASSCSVYLNGTYLDETTDNQYAFTGLTNNTNYTFSVVSVCSSSDSSHASSLAFRTPLADPVTSFPYFCGFENADDMGNWLLVNGTQTNHWFRGTGASNGGVQSLYITSDDSTNTYNIGSNSTVFACLYLNLQAGEYAYSYDWRAYGESSYDFIRAAVVPESTTITAGSYNGFNNGTSVPTNGIAIDNISNASTYRLNLQSSWQNQNGIFTIATPGVYKMVFMWRNDGSGGTMPPAAIDNIQVVRNTCPAPINFHTTYVGQDTVTVAWTAGGEETQWVVSDGVTETPVTSTSYTFTGLYPNTGYNFSVRGICSDEDTSMLATLGVRTACSDMTLPYSDDFESYTVLTNGATGVHPQCWQYVMTNASYSSNSYQPQIYYYATPNQYTHSGSYSLYFYGVSYTCLPRLSDDYNMNDVSLGFWARHGSAYYGLMVGVMSDPDSIETFDTIAVVPFTSTSVPQYFEFNLSNYTGTGRYIALRNYYTTNPSNGNSTVYVDDVEVWRNSSCPTPSFIAVNGVSNNVATINWGDTSNNAYTQFTVYYSTVNNILATDSAVVSSGTSYTLTGLSGNTTYYVWVKGSCSLEDSRTVSTSFTTTPDCMPVENLTVVSVDYHAFGLDWEAPSAGEPATRYVVAWKAADATVWNTDTVLNRYYYISGLAENSSYQYSVTTVCDEALSAANSGSVQTLPCGDMVTEGGAEFSYLPTYPYYNYSYTQQIYLDEELTNVDTISAVSFFNTGTVTNRSVVLYMANTAKSSFSGTNDFVASSDLTQVANATLNGTGWMSITLSTPFVRNAGSNLVVAMADNTGEYVQSQPWAVTSTTAPRGLYYYHDDAIISPATPSATYMDAVNYVPQMLVVGPTCTIPACGTPIVMVSDVQTDEISLVWNAEAGSSYEVAYRLHGDGTWTVADAANTTGSITLNGLAASADYDVRVSLNCSGTTLVGTRTVSTACGPVALPLTENFQSSLPGNYFSRTCWTVDGTGLGTVYPYPLVTRLQGAEDNHLCLFYNGAYMVLPQVDAPLDDLQISFDFTQGGDNVHFLMGLVASPNDPINMMHVLDTIVRSDYDTTTATIVYTYQFAGIDTAYSHYHIAFWDAFNEGYSFIDNLIVEPVPQCAPATGLAATTTTTSATITWAAAGSTASGYRVEYGPRNFTPGTGTFTTATGTSATISGLAAGTNYDAYVYTLCGTDETSRASQVVRFATQCDVIATLPYSVDFENIMDAGSSATNVLPNCWASEVLSSGTMPHVAYNGSAIYAPSPSHNFYFQEIGVAALPEMNMDLDGTMVSFYAYNSNPSNYGLILGTVDSATAGFSASFVPYDTVFFDEGNAINYVGFMNDYTGTANRLALMNYNADPQNNYAYIYVDNLVVNTIPSCIPPVRVRPTLLTNVRADLSWNMSNGASYSIEYGPHGFTPGTGTTLTSTTRSVSITGLTPLTQYDVRIVGICSATEHSDTAVYTFTTLRAAPVTNYPYECDFSDTTIANAWELVNGTQVNAWYVGGTFGNSGASLYISSDNGATNSYIVSTTSNVSATRTFSLGAENYTFAYDWRVNGENCCDYIRVFLAPVSYNIAENSSNNIGSSGAPSGWIALDGGNKLNSVSSWQHVSVNVNVPVAGNYNLVFFWHNDGSAGTQPPAAIDNIQVSRNVCPVEDIELTAATEASLSIAWVGNSESYQVEYGTYGFSHGTGFMVSTTTTSVTLNNLFPATGYDIYVRGICNGSTDTSRWYRATFATEMCASPNMACNYDTTTAATSSSYSPLGYSYYNYGYTQTIIDSAYMARLGGTSVGAVAFKPLTTTAGDKYNGITVYMANVSESDLSAGFILPDATHDFVPVIQGESFNYTDTSWQMHTFSNNFVWDGHSNVLFAVKRDNGTYLTGGSFSAHNAGAAKTRYVYQDITAYDITTVTGGTTSSNVGDLRFYSCGGEVSCIDPMILSTAATETSITFDWSITGASSYEVVIMENTWDENNANPVVVNDTTYTFTNLTGNVTYYIGVRSLCSSTNVSPWATTSVTTDMHPCATPSGVTVMNRTYDGAQISWTPGEDETAWMVNIHCASPLVDTNISVSGQPEVTVSGLPSGVTFEVTVRAFCGENNYSDPSAAATLATFECDVPSNVLVSELTTTSAKVSWNGTGSYYRLEYGRSGFASGSGTSVTVENHELTSTTSYVITGLEPGLIYDVYVRTLCTNEISSNWTNVVNFQTNDDQQGIEDVNNANVALFPNPATTTVTLTGIDGPATVTIVDMNGRENGKWSVENGELTIDLTGYAQGAYFVRVTGEQVNAIRKLIVK
ncbi:MAG: fibronectin type III domain-containing protein [Bacteroidales bacterium]|nr:fibronectin type III domain-containing protein [Bacteroidales bacterium]